MNEVNLFSVQDQHQTHTKQPYRSAERIIRDEAREDET